jgi:hypothetical protein
LVKIDHQYPLYTDIYDIYILQNGTLKIYQDDVFLYQTQISLDELDEYGAEMMIEEVLEERLDIWPDELYQSSTPLSDSELYLFHYEIVRMQTEEYIINVYRDGTIQVFKEEELIHQRNVFAQ